MDDHGLLEQAVPTVLGPNTSGPNASLLQSAGAGDQQNSDPAQPSGAIAPAQEKPSLVYGSAEEFLHEQLLPLYHRMIDSRNGKWCRQWYLHPEAVSRVEALWRSWEHFRLSPATGMSVWWRDHVDHHMAVLLSQKGPFHACGPDRHHSSEPFPCDYAPAGWFPSEKTTEQAPPRSYR